MMIDAAALSQRQMSVVSPGSRTEVLPIADTGAFGSALAAAEADVSSQAGAVGKAGGTAVNSQSNSGVLMMLYAMMGSGLTGNGLFSGQTLSLLATVLSGTLFSSAGSDGTGQQLLSLLSGNVMGLASTAAGSAGAVIPESGSVAVTPGIVSTVGNRSPQLYRQVIDQFSVETNPRYAVNKNGNNDTYCNIFLWDVTRAMGAEIPHYVDPDTLAPRYYPDTAGATEMTANRIYDWLGQVGADYGWYEVTAEQAQGLANQGLPVVTAKRNNGGHGHVQVVCPSTDGSYDSQRGVSVAQAGSRLRDYAYMGELFKNSGEIKYYAHL